MLKQRVSTSRRRAPDGGQALRHREARCPRPMERTHERGLSESQVRQIIQQHTEQRTWGLLGEPRVNVLEVNLALDQVKAMAAK